MQNAINIEYKYSRKECTLILKNFYNSYRKCLKLKTGLKPLKIMTVYKFIEDFDNEELDEYERIEQLREAVIEFNETYSTDYDPGKTVKQYFNRKKYAEN